MAAIVVGATVIAGIVVVGIVVVFIELLSVLLLVAIANGTATATVITMSAKKPILMAFEILFPFKIFDN